MVPSPQASGDGSRDPGPGAARPPAPRSTVAFDVIFGIVLPILCLRFDPGILRQSGLGLGTPLIGGYGAAACVLILLQMAILATWLLWPRGAVALAAPLLLGGVVALALGVVLLPVSVPFIRAVIGLLGLVPFGTAVVFLRNGTRAFRAARARPAPRLALAAAAIMVAATVALPVAVQRTVNARTQALLDAAESGDPRREADAVARLKPFGWLADSTEVGVRWRRSDDTALQERLARAWHAATGDHLVWLID